MSDTEVKNCTTCWRYMDKRYPCAVPGIYLHPIENCRGYERISGGDKKMDDSKVGLIAKYKVVKLEDGEVVSDCFVLRPDKDPAAVTALQAYAMLTPNSMLAEDIFNWVGHPTFSLHPTKTGSTCIGDTTLREIATWCNPKKCEQVDCPFYHKDDGSCELMSEYPKGWASILQGAVDRGARPIYTNRIAEILGVAEDEEIKIVDGIMGDVTLTIGNRNRVLPRLESQALLYAINHPDKVIRISKDGDTTIKDLPPVAELFNLRVGQRFTVDAYPCEGGYWITRDGHIDNDNHNADDGMVLYMINHKDGVKPLSKESFNHEPGYQPRIAELIGRNVGDIFYVDMGPEDGRVIGPCKLTPEGHISICGTLSCTVAERAIEHPESVLSHIGLTDEETERCKTCGAHWVTCDNAGVVEFWQEKPIPCGSGWEGASKIAAVQKYLFPSLEPGDLINVKEWSN